MCTDIGAYTYLVNIPEPVQYHIYALAFPFDLWYGSVTFCNIFQYAIYWYSVLAMLYCIAVVAKYCNILICWYIVSPLIGMLVSVHT